MEISDLREIWNDRRYPWGTPVEFHNVGPYSILEVEETKNRVKTGLKIYHPFVEGKDTHVMSSTIEGAMILAIAYHRVGRTNFAQRAEAASLLLNSVECPPSTTPCKANPLDLTSEYEHAERCLLSGLGVPESLLPAAKM